MNKKQVMDIRPNSDGISQAESNEQQRNWSEDFLRKKSNDPMANYDPTRTHLNFEVARGGIVQPIDKSKSIMQKMTDNLAARGIKDPNARENVRRRQNTLAQFIFGGSRERMNELAFGNQTLNLDKGPTTPIWQGTMTSRNGQKMCMPLLPIVSAKRTSSASTSILTRPMFTHIVRLFH